MTISLQHAVDVCRIVEAAVSPIGFHCALTGGCLYRGGSDKDIDIVLYPHDPTATRDNEIAYTQLTEALVAAGFTDRFVTDENYVNRIVWICAHQGLRIDFFIS